MKRQHKDTHDHVDVFVYVEEINLHPFIYGNSLALG